MRICMSVIATIYSKGTSEDHGKQSGDDDNLVCPPQAHRVLQGMPTDRQRDKETMTHTQRYTNTEAQWHMLTITHTHVHTHTYTSAFIANAGDNKVYNKSINVYNNTIIPVY